MRKLFNVTNSLSMKHIERSSRVDMLISLL